MRRAIATETSERYTWPMTAGMISSARLLETQPQSNSLGPSSWKAKGEAPLAVLLTAPPGFGFDPADETPDSLYAEGAARPVFRLRDDGPALDARTHELRQRD